MLEQLLAQLQDEDIQEQELAAQEIINLNDPVCIKPLVKLLSHPTPITRATSAYILGELADLTDINCLSKLTLLLSDQDLFVQIQACNALGQIGNFQAFDPIFQLLLIENLYRDPENILGNTALAVLYNLDSELLRKNLIALLPNDDLTSSMASHWLAKIIPSPLAEHLLEISVTTQNIELQKSIAKALDNLDDQTAIALSLKCLEAAFNSEIEEIDSIEDSIKSVFGFLAVSMTPEDFNNLVFSFVTSPQVEKRKEGIWQLALVNKNLAIPALLSATKDPNSQVQWIAIHLLGEIGDENNVTNLVNCLKNASDEISAKIASSLGKLASKGVLTAIEPLTTLLNSSKEIRKEAILALGQTKSQQVLQNLIIQLKDPDPTIRNIAVQAISLIDAPQTLDILISILSDEDEEVRYNTIQALENLNNERAIKPLEDLLKNTGEQDLFLIESIKLVIKKIKNPSNDQSQEIESDFSNKSFHDEDEWVS